MAAKLEELGGNRYRIRVGAGRDPITGRYRQLSRTFTATTKKHAKEQASRAEAELRRQIKDRQGAAGTVGYYARAWLDALAADRRSAHTVYRAESIVRCIVRDLGPIPVERLKVADVEQWFTKLRAENVSQAKGKERYRSESTVHHYYRVLHRILGIVERREGVPAITRRVEHPDRSKPNPRPPGSDTLQRLIDTADGGLRVAVEMAAFLGLRRGEILAARWSDIDGLRLHVQRSTVDVPGRPVAVGRTKTVGSVRTVDIPSRLAALLLAWRGQLEAAAELHADAVILPDLDADVSGRQPWRPTSLSGAWRRHCRNQGAPDVRFHDLRHWAATGALARGVPVPEVARMMGHAQTSTTVNVYAGVSAGSRNIGELLAGELD